MIDSKFMDVTKLKCYGRAIYSSPWKYLTCRLVVYTLHNIGKCFYVNIFVDLSQY